MSAPQKQVCWQSYTRLKVCKYYLVVFALVLSAICFYASLVAKVVQYLYDFIIFFCFTDEKHCNTFLHWNKIIWDRHTNNIKRLAFQLTFLSALLWSGETWNLYAIRLKCSYFRLLLPKVAWTAWTWSYLNHMIDEAKETIWSFLAG